MKKIFFCTKEELKKAVLFKKGWIVILLSLIIHTVICAASSPELQRYTFDTKLYKYYTEQFCGTYSEENEEAIKSEFEVQKKISSEPFDAEIMSSEEYTEFINRTAIAAQKALVLERINEKYADLKQCSSYGAELVYDIEFTEYCRKFKQDFASLICIAILTIIIFFGDTRCGMDKLLYSSKTGKSCVLKSKLFAIAVIALIVSAVFSAEEILIISNRLDMGKLFAPIQSFSGFENCTLKITAAQGLAIGIVLKVVFSIFSALLLALFSAITKNEIISVSAMTVILAIGALNDSGKRAEMFDLSVYLSGINALSNEVITQNFLTIFVCAAAFLTAEFFASLMIQMK